MRSVLSTLRRPSSRSCALSPTYHLPATTRFEVTPLGQEDIAISSNLDCGAATQSVRDTYAFDSAITPALLLGFLGTTVEQLACAAVGRCELATSNLSSSLPQLKSASWLSSTTDQGR